MSLKEKLRLKKLTIGSWISFEYPQTCEIMAKAGFDWLVIDMEHTAIDSNQCLHLIQIIESNGVTPLVRVGKNDPLHIKRAMDAGAHGIIVPMINTTQDAKKALDSLYYPPIGNRGVGLGRAQNYGIGFEDYKIRADNSTIFIPQIEHIDGVNHMEDIIAIDGVDGFIVGPYDLSGSLGLPGQWEHPLFINALDRIKKVLMNSNKPGGYHVVHSNQLDFKHRVQEGYKFIAYGDDMVFFAEKIRAESEFMLRMRD